ncbi:TPA: hypothetical protein ACHKQC_004486, partial [Escherichia coli]
SVSSNSKTTSTRNHYYKRSNAKKSLQGVKTTWSFDETEPRSKYKLRRHIPVNASAMRNYYIWRRTVLAGHHPRDAAHMIGSQYCFKSADSGIAWFFNFLYVDFKPPVGAPVLTDANQ